MKRSLLRGAVAAGLTAALGLGVAATPAAAHDSCCTTSWSWSADALADKMERKADVLRYKASRMPYVTVLGATAKTTLATRLTNAAAALDTLATQTRTVTTQSGLDAKYAAYKARLTQLAPTLRAVGQAFYGTHLRAKARYYTAKAAALQTKLNATTGLTTDERTAIQSMINAAKTKLSLARSALTPSVLGVRIMTDPSHAASTLSVAAKRIYGAKLWLRSASYTLTWA